jgi:hypothetical protein
MIFDQAYYTSCEIGLKGIKGFQMNAASSGINQNILNILERYSIYIPPISMPTRPNLDDLSIFPKSLNYIKLTDGSAVLSRSIYLGMDYSGRFGNYFTHFIVHKSSTELINHIIPIMTWDARFWKEEPINNIEIPQISSLEIGKFKKCEDFIISMSTSKHSRYLKSFFCCIQKSLETKRRIIIVDNDVSIAKLIASISIILPNSLLKDLTFTTYTKNPYNIDTLITGTTVDSDFMFSSSEIDHQYFVFDFINNRYTSSPALSKYATVLGEWFETQSYDKIKFFKEFVDNLDILISPICLDYLINICFLLNGQDITFRELENTHKFIYDNNLYNRYEILNAVIAALLDSNNNTSNIVSIVTDIFNFSITSTSISVDGKNDAAKFYIDWMIQRVIPMSSDEDINKIVQFINDKNIPMSMWEFILKDVTILLNYYQDIKNLHRLLIFSDGVNILGYLTPSLEKVCKQILTGDIQSESSQKVLDFFIKNNISSSIDNLIYEHIKKLYTKSYSNINLVMISNSNTSLKKLALIADTANDVSFLLFIYAFIISSSTKKGQDTVELLKKINTKYNKLTVDDFDNFYRIIWDKDVIDIKDAAIIINYNERISLQSKIFLSILINELLHCPSIISPKGDILTILQKLKVNEKLYTDLPPELIKKINICFKISSYQNELKKCKSADSIFKLVQSIIKFIPDNNHIYRKEIFKLTLKYTNLNSDSRLIIPHMFSQLPNIDKKHFMVALQDFLNSYKYKESNSVQMWIQIFLFIIKSINESDHFKTTQHIYFHELKSAFNKIPHKEQDEIRSIITKNNKYNNTKWKTWQRDTGLLKTISRYIFTKNIKQER